MTRIMAALGTVNPVLLAVTVIVVGGVIGGAGYHAWCEWSDAANEAQAQHDRDNEDDIEREYREMLEAHGWGTS